MKKAFLTGILLLSFCSLFAQNQAIIYELKKPLGTLFIQNDRVLTPKQLLEVTRSNPVAYSEMRMAKNRYNVGQVLGVMGGALVGWPLGTAIGGGDPNWTLAAVGAGLIGLSIPFSIAYTRHAQHAARIYNHDLQQTGMTNLDIEFGMTSNGLGIKLTFK